MLPDHAANCITPRRHNPPMTDTPPQAMPTPGAQNHSTDARLIDLEIKASFLEDTVDQLDSALARQQQQIEALMREVLQLRAQWTSTAPEAAGNPRDELPPHY